MVTNTKDMDVDIQAEMRDTISISDVEDERKFKDDDDPAKVPSTPSTTADPEKGINRNTCAEETQQPIIDNWTGPDDPENPYNWPLWSRVYHALVPAFLGFAVTFGTSIFSPSVEPLMTDFNISRTVAILPISVYTLGLGFGPVFSAPLSEKFGRKIIYIVSVPICMLFTLGAGFCNHIASLVICRFFAGIAGSPPLAVGGGTSTDIFPPQKRALMTSLFMIAPFLGPSLGPVVGGFTAQHKDWRWSQWVLLMVSGFFYLFAIPMKETYKPEILRQRAKRLGISPAKAGLEKKVSARRTIVQNLIRPMHMLTTESAVFFFSVYTAFAFGVIFLFFAAFPFVFQRPPYNFSASQSGLLFLAIGIGVPIGSLTGVIIDQLWYQKHSRAALKEGRHAAPEHRLYNAMIGSFGLPIGMFWFGWTADKGLHWAIPAAAAIPFAWGNICVFCSAVLYMSDVYGAANGASALAANGILRYTLGGIFPLFTVQMYAALGIGWATSLLGFLAIIMLPIPLVFFKYGPTIRKRSSYPTLM